MTSSLLIDFLMLLELLQRRRLSSSCLQFSTDKASASSPAFASVRLIVEAAERAVLSI